MAAMRREALGASGLAMLVTIVESDGGCAEVAEACGRPRPWKIRPKVICGEGRIGKGLVAFRWVAFRMSGSAGRDLIWGRLGLTGICFTNTGRPELRIKLEGAGSICKTTGKRSSGWESEDISRLFKPTRVARVEQF